MLDYARQRRGAGDSQVFEKPEEKKDYIVSTEDNDEYRFVQITPPPKKAIDKKDLIAISSLPVWAQKAFGSTTHLNTIQTKVFPAAFQSKRNLLISAPTGSGKTNIAMLTVMSEISHHITDHQKAT